MRVSSELKFSAEFACVKCESIIGVDTYRAIVGAPGLEVRCRHCKTDYVVTELGASLLSEVGKGTALPPLAGTYDIESAPTFS